MAAPISGTGTLDQERHGHFDPDRQQHLYRQHVINAGILQIGNGGATGSVAGNIVNNASLFFNRSDTFTYDGVISGTGSLGKFGPGTLVLAGNNTYTGVTNVNQGVLQIGNGATSGSIAGDSRQRRHRHLRPLRHPHLWRHCVGLWATSTRPAPAR